MKGLILDQGLPRSAASLLRAIGIEAVHVGELGDKEERLTVNSVMRVAIQILSDRIELATETSPNNEQELLTLVREKMRWA